MLRLPKRTTQVDANFSARARVTAGGGVDFSPQQRALSRLSQVIGQGPRYREVDVSSGLESIARVTGAVGREVQQFAARSQEITDQRKLYSNETKLKLAQEQIAADLINEKDPAKWGAAYDERMQPVLAELDTEGMSPYAVSVMQAHAERMVQLGRVRTEVDAVKHNESLLLNELEMGSQAARKTGDARTFGELEQRKAELTGASPETVKSVLTLGGLEIDRVNDTNATDTLNTMLAAKDFEGAFRFIESNEHLNKGGNAHRKTVALETAAKASMVHQGELEIATRPKFFLEELEAGTSDIAKKINADPVLKAEMKVKTERAITQNSAIDARRVGEAVAATGSKLPVLHLLKTNPLAYPNLTKMQREEFITELEKPVPDNNPDDYVAMLTEITNFQGGEDAVDNEAKLTIMEEMAKAKFSGEMLSSINRTATAARARLKGEGGEEDDPIPGQITAAFKEGYFGNYELPWSKADGATLSPADAARKDVMKDSTTTVVDQRLRAEAAKRMGEIMLYNKSLKDAKVPAHERAEKVRAKMEAMNVTLGVPDMPRIIQVENPLLPGVDGKSPSASMPAGTAPAPTMRGTLQQAQDIFKKYDTDTPNPKID